MHNENGRASADHGYTNMVRWCATVTMRTVAQALTMATLTSARGMQRSHNTNGRASADHGYADTHHTTRSMQTVAQAHSAQKYYF